MMDREKLIKVFKFYQSEITELGVQSKQLDPQGYEVPVASLPKEAILGHCMWMCEEAIEYVVIGRVDKANRWLGDVQGMLSMLGMYTITQLREHSTNPITVS
jgi:hypothetical protein